MGGTLLLESMAAAASVGMGCGTCCGSSTSVMLYGYLTTHARGISQTSRAFLSFFLGKVMAVMLLCCITSLLGQQIIGEDGEIAGIPAAAVVDVLMIIMGIRLLIGWFRERKGKNSCADCRHCASQDKTGRENKKIAGYKPGTEDVQDRTDHRNVRIEGNPGRGLLFGMGFGYGISPCAPLILITGYAAALPVGYAAVLGSVFAAASTISPTLIFILLSGALAKKMYKEIPAYMTWFRLACYVLMILLFTISLIKSIIS